MRNVTYMNSYLHGERGLSLLGVIGGGGFIHDVLFENIVNPRGISYGNYGGSAWLLAEHPNNRRKPKVYNVEYRDIRDNGHCEGCGNMAFGSVCPNVSYTGATRCEGQPLACPDRPHGGFIPWVRVANQSNVYGQIPGPPFNQSTPGLPFLGLTDSASECEAACERRSNCTQYSWALDVPKFERHCFGRCDDVWKLHAVPSQYTVSAGRRVAAGNESLATQADVPSLRYGCKRNATDQFGGTIRFPWPVCIPLDGSVNNEPTWPNWGPALGDYPSLQACKASGCKTDDAT